MKPMDRKAVVLKLKEFRTRDGDTGYALRGSIPIGGNKNLALSIRVDKDGCVQMKEDRKYPDRMVAFMDAAVFNENEKRDSPIRRQNYRK